MAKWFRIKNKKLRWVAGLGLMLLRTLRVVVIIAAIVSIISTPVGYGVRALGKIWPFLGNLITKEILNESWIKSINNDIVASIVASLSVGFCALVFLLCVAALTFIAIVGTSQLFDTAKEYGDDYFDSIGDKEKPSKSS